ncbi:hypothetical protein CBER1_03844 [Cercospora berteroae]|uniref:Uncharacterized protein n=1 Tax=Cercospora berteroae TaxID=357750 RepID=A0A2S6CE97_9PEZI|nr:hypothetical protein CBER1_03844 [Cercospora berteroae]
MGSIGRRTTTSQIFELRWKASLGQMGMTGWALIETDGILMGTTEMGLDHWGVNRQGRDREGYDEGGLDIHLFYRDGHDRFGIHRSWYPDHDDEGGLTFNVFGYGQDGYNREGRDMDGFDREGIDVEGYNYCGMDKWGRYRNGLRYNGYTYHHRDLQGNIEPGYRLMPDGNVRIDHVCNTCWCPCELEREPSSANICAICRLTIEEGPLTHDFEMNSGPVHDTCHKIADEDYVTVWMMSDWERAGFLGLAEMIARLQEGKEEQIAVAEK